MRVARDERILLYVALAAAIVGVAVRIAAKLFLVDFAAPELWEFDDIARNLLATGVYSFHTAGVPDAYMPPGYSLLVAGLYRIFGSGLVAHIALGIVTLLGECTLVVLIGVLAHRMWGLRTGLLAFTLASVWPMLLLMSGRLHGISIYAPLLVGASLAVASRLTLRGTALAAGGLLGVYALFRFEALLIAVPFGLVLVFRRGESARRRLAAGLLFALLACAPLAPWVVRNYRAFGSPLLSTTAGMNFLRGHHPTATGTGRDFWSEAHGRMTRFPGMAPWFNEAYASPRDAVLRDADARDAALRHISEHPWHEAQLTARKAFFFLVGDFTHPVGRLPFVWIPSLVALVFGFLHYVRNSSGTPVHHLLWGVFLIVFMLALVFFTLPRYRMVVEFVPILFISGWGASLSDRRRPPV